VEPRHVAFPLFGEWETETGQRHSPSRLTFNLSHSRDRALLAITQNDPIAVDLEFVDSGFASESVGRAFAANTK
jgi:phosphopantetheinyl transferase